MKACFYGTPSTIRTYGLRLRRALLYPAELWKHLKSCLSQKSLTQKVKILLIYGFLKMERETRLELATVCLEGRSSSQLSYSRSIVVRMRRLELPHREAPDPKSGVSTNFTTSAINFYD